MVPLQGERKDPMQPVNLQQILAQAPIEEDPEVEAFIFNNNLNEFGAAVLRAKLIATASNCQLKDQHIKVCITRLCTSQLAHFNLFRNFGLLFNSQTWFSSE